MKSSTETLIVALRVLARDIQSDDGIANAAIAEAADRLEEMSTLHGAETDRRATGQQTIEDIIPFSGGVSCTFLGKIINMGIKQFCTGDKNLTIPQVECIRRAAALIEVLLKDELQVTDGRERFMNENGLGAEDMERDV